MEAYLRDSFKMYKSQLAINVLHNMTLKLTFSNFYQKQFDDRDMKAFNKKMDAFFNGMINVFIYMCKYVHAYVYDSLQPDHACVFQRCNMHVYICTYLYISVYMFVCLYMEAFNRTIDSFFTNVASASA